MAKNADSVKAPKFLSLFVGILGLLMVVIGISVYAFASSQLASQNITVEAVTDDNPGYFYDKPVRGPFTAMAQASAIRQHCDAATGGKTFGELPNVASSDGKTYRSDVTMDNTTDGQTHKAGDALSATDAKTYAARATAQQASFLEASLFTSVIAFGVGALIVGLGLTFIVVSLALVSTVKRLTPAVTKE